MEKKIEGNPAHSRVRIVNKRFARFPSSAFALFFLLSAFAALAVASLVEKSATFDEGNHLTRGLYPLSGNGYPLNREHPPLVNLIQALPVHLTMRPNIPPATPEMYPFFSHSEATLWKTGNDGKKMILIARLATVALSLALGALIFLWGRELHGAEGGVVSLAFFAFSPMMLAHGRLVTTDMGLALFLFAFFLALWKLTTDPSPGRLVVAGLCLGAAAASKHLALAVLPLSFLIMTLAEAAGPASLVNIFRRASSSPSSQSLTARLPALAGVWLAMTAIAFLLVWALYGFQVGKIDGVGMTLPAPDYFGGLAQGWQSLKEGRVFYLNGEVSSEGWLSYFPLAFWYKTPWPLLAALALAVSLHLTGKIRIGRGMRFIALAVGLLAVAVIFKKANLGLRYLLWLYPFLFLYLGSIVRAPFWRWAVVPLLAWLVIETLAAHPNYISYFNQTIPAREKRWRLVDSNLDWGQDLPALARYQRRENIDSLKLGYFGTADPRAYGVAAEPLPSFMQSEWNGSPTLKLEGVIAVSATLLQGAYNRPPDFYAPLRDATPTAEIGGGSILIFDYRQKPGPARRGEDHE